MMKHVEVTQPGLLRRVLRANGTALLTADGEPFALAVALAEDDDPLEQARIFRRAHAELALARIRTRAAAFGLDELSAEEIQREITAARRERLL